MARLESSSRYFILWVPEEGRKCVGKYNRPSKSVSDDSLNVDLPEDVTVTPVSEQSELAETEVDEWWFEQ